MNRPMQDKELQQLLSSLSGMLRGGAFSPFIEFINFPRYRNFEARLQIDFTFPVTAIVGQNGTGKTSLLQALSGAPRNSSPGDWWFGTALDPIDEADARGRNLPHSEKAAFWYSYRDAKGSQFRALKSRIRRAGNPDYWEPSRPVAAYGMDGKDRHPVVQMNAKYLNFKTQINAFDRCFYFAQDDATFLRALARTKEWQDLQSRLKPSRRRPPKVQDYLRKRSKKLRKVLVDGMTVTSAGNKMHNPRLELTAAELKDLSGIMGREYTYGAIVEHRFYEAWGTSVLLRTKTLEYSEAFAGSGESAVTRLVHELHNASKGSLFLLDEPETSLHPGAQQELIHFLLRISKEKQLQIVISTHSPTIVRPLPPAAIHVLAVNSTGEVSAYRDVQPDEAFFVLGHPVENKIQIVVEDVLTRRILEAVAVSVSDQFAARLQIEYRPGGESGMKQDASTLMLDKERNVHFVFDGDKADSIGPFSLDEIPITATPKDLDDLINKHLRAKIRLHQNSNMSDEDKNQIRLRFMRYANDRFHALPTLCPEQAIWNDDAAFDLLRMTGNENKPIPSSEEYKLRFDQLTRIVRSVNTAPTSQEIFNIQDIFITRFCKEKGDLYQSILKLLRGVANG